MAEIAGGDADRPDRWTSTAVRDEQLAGAGPTTTAASGRRTWLRWHLPFMIVLLAGAAIRVIVVLAYRPAVLFPDSISYLAAARRLVPGVNRPLGYSGLLAPLLYSPHPLLVVAIVQHLMGLTMAVVLYALLLRWKVRRWLAIVATLPVLFDSYQLLIEQYIMADTFFELLMVVGLVVLAWKRTPIPLWACAVSGFALALGAITRLDGAALLLPALGYVILRQPGVRLRVVGALAMVVTFAVPVGLYAVGYDLAHGKLALSGYSGHFLYGRVMPFATCTGLSLPSYERSLCPTTPPGHREPTDFWIWSPKSPAYHLHLPPGKETDAVLSDFGKRVVLNQPGTYAKSVLTNFVDGFALVRNGSARFQFQRDYPLNGFDPAPVSHKYGDQTPYANHRYTGFLYYYGRYVNAPGPIEALALVLGLLGGFGVGRARRSGMRLVCLLFAVGGLAVLLPSNAASIFSWRYVLPSLELLPVAGALGFTALTARSHRREPARERQT